MGSARRALRGHSNHHRALAHRARARVFETKGLELVWSYEISRAEEESYQALGAPPGLTPAALFFFLPNAGEKGSPFFLSRDDSGFEDHLRGTSFNFGMEYERALFRVRFQLAHLKTPTVRSSDLPLRLIFY